MARRNGMVNPLLNVDSYKPSHAALYPDHTENMCSYISSREKNFPVVFFGLQIYLQKFLSKPITWDDLNEADDFWRGHMGMPFDMTPWQRIISEYCGFIPIRIQAVPEGLRVPGNVPLVRITCPTDENLAWLGQYFETQILRAVWYPTTIATNGYDYWQLLEHYYRSTSDNPEAVKFALHDFGTRATTCYEQAKIGGAAHLVYFEGSDNVPGINCANSVYGSSMAGFSIPATEHSVQCAWGPLRQDEYIDRVLDTYTGNGKKACAIVIDAYDTMREALRICDNAKRIQASGTKVMFRPDSGDAVKNILEILEMQAKYFGYRVNSKGFKVIQGAGVVQGDGVDYDTIANICLILADEGWSIENVVFGSGGALLQKDINRDTFSFAQKLSATFEQKKWQDVFKTTPGKESLRGYVSTVLDCKTNEIKAVSGVMKSHQVPLMRTVYDRGDLINQTNFHDVRKRAQR
jgi:nicotinamide phosphoribosyltransferase